MVTFAFSYESVSVQQIQLPSQTPSTVTHTCDNLQSVHFAGLLDIHNILLADTGISRQTDGHSFSDHLISGSVLCHRVS
jgi:hypothetical protein